jgi:hypothetical protein
MSNITWSQFKLEFSIRALTPQFTSENSSYYIKAMDGFNVFSCEIDQTEPKNADQIDFEDNYKNNWNVPLEYRDRNGLKRVHTSPKPEGTITYFSGAGDSVDVGSGERLLFNMKATDISKEKIITFSEAINIKDGIITTIGAPIGSYLNVDILDPQDNIIMSFARSLNLLGTSPIYLNSQDSEELESILKLRVTVYNSNGLGEQDYTVDFKVVGNIEMYRSKTI